MWALAEAAEAAEACALNHDKASLPGKKGRGLRVDLKDGTRWLAVHDRRVYPWQVIVYHGFGGQG